MALNTEREWWLRAAVLWAAYKRDPEPVTLAQINEDIAAFDDEDRANVARVAARLLQREAEQN